MITTNIPIQKKSTHAARAIENEGVASTFVGCCVDDAFYHQFCDVLFLLWPLHKNDNGDDVIRRAETVFPKFKKWKTIQIEKHEALKKLEKCALPPNNSHILIYSFITYDMRIFRFVSFHNILNIYSWKLWKFVSCVFAFFFWYTVFSSRTFYHLNTHTVLLCWIQLKFFLYCEYRITAAFRYRSLSFDRNIFLWHVCLFFLFFLLSFFPSQSYCIFCSRVCVCEYVW